MANDDIREVMDDEKGRGKRQPTETSARRERRKQLRLLREMYEMKDLKEFEDALIREFGIERGSPAFERAVKAWREGGEV